MSQTRWQVTLQRLTTLVQVLGLFRVFIEGNVWQFFDISISNWHVETITELAHAVHVHFLNLVSDVFTFSGVTHAVTFNGVSQNNSRLTFGFFRFFQCCVDFLRIVTTTVQCPDLVIAHVFNQSGGFRVTTEEVLTNISAIFGFEGLVVTVQRFVHQLDQFTASVFTQQLIPTTAPDNLDHVPASACEDAFQFVNDFAVTGDWAIQALQVTVDDEAQVVQFFTSCDSDRTFRFWLIHLTVAQESVNGLFRSIFQATVFQIFQEFSLIDCTDWAQAH